MPLTKTIAQLSFLCVNLHKGTQVVLVFVRGIDILYIYQLCSFMRNSTEIIKQLGIKNKYINFFEGLIYQSRFFGCLDHSEYEEIYN